MKENLVELRNLSKEFKNLRAVDNVNIHIEKGSIYGLVGENGSGKSTILKMLMGLIMPTSGEISIFGKTEEIELNRIRSKIGGVIESPNFYPYMSARKNLEYYRIQRGIIDDKIIDEILELVGLEDTGDKKYKNFSLGMKQRLGIGLAIMSEPEILVLDEPINGLDPTGIVELRKLLLELNREKGTTIIISSHILGELSQIATNYGFINKGVLLEEISSKELKAKYRNYLSIKVDDIDKATFIIETELNSLDYKVGGENTLELFEYIDRSDEVVRAFYENGIGIKSIKEEGIELEDYYIKLIGGARNA